MNIVIGGGPAGFFGAITARLTDPTVPVVILEKNPEVLAKVKISGGGRCNVTHACFDPRALALHYPRGHKELIGPFHKWGPTETVAWFAERGVELKTEADGRMFPVTDSSATIVTCLVQAARSVGVEIRTRCPVAEIRPAPSGSGYSVRLAAGDDLTCNRILLATGGKTSASSKSHGYAFAASLGHSVNDPVASLFTFRIQNPLLDGLAGISVPLVDIKLAQEQRGDRALRQSGPILVTHRGLSGPAVLRFSAWGARRLNDLGHRFALAVNWTGGQAAGDLDQDCREWSRQNGKQRITTGGPVKLPIRLWAALVRQAGIAEDTRWGDLDRSRRGQLVSALTDTHLEVTGKNTFKEEFVTCGGVSLREVDFRTMGSRLRPGLFLAGEVLDIDGITGGFNFQSCWTTGFLAGRGMAASIV